MKQAEKGAKRRRRGGRALAALLLACLVLTQAQMAWAGEMSTPPSEEEGSVGEENDGETQETGTQEAGTREAGVQNTEIREPELQTAAQNVGTQEAEPQEQGTQNAEPQESGGPVSQETSEPAMQEPAAQESGEPVSEGTPGAGTGTAKEGTDAEESASEKNGGGNHSGDMQTAETTVSREVQTADENAAAGEETEGSGHESLAAATEGETAQTEEGADSGKEIKYYDYWYSYNGWQKGIGYTDGSYELFPLAEAPDLSDAGADCVYVGAFGNNQLIIEGDIAAKNGLCVQRGSECTIIVNGNVPKLSDGINIGKLHVTINGDVGNISISDAYEGTVKIEGTVAGGEKVHWEEKDGVWIKNTVAIVNPCAAGEFRIENGVWSDTISFRGEGEPAPDKEIDHYDYRYGDGEWKKDITYIDGSRERLPLSGQPDLSDGGASAVYIDSLGDQHLSIEGNISTALFVRCDCEGEIRINGDVKLLQNFNNEEKVNIVITGNVDSVAITDLYQGTIRIEGTCGGGSKIHWTLNSDGHSWSSSDIAKINSCSAGEFCIENGVWSDKITFQEKGELLGYYYFYDEQGWGKTLRYSDGIEEELRLDQQPDFNDGASRVTIHTTDGVMILEGDIGSEDLWVSLDIVGESQVEIHGNVHWLDVEDNAQVLVKGNVESVDVTEDFQGTLRIEGTVERGYKSGVKADGSFGTIAGTEPCAAGEFVIENGHWSDKIVFIKREIESYYYSYRPGDGEWEKEIWYTDGSYEDIALDGMPKFEKGDRVTIYGVTEPMTLTGDFESLSISECSSPVTVEGNVLRIHLGNISESSATGGDVIIKNSVSYLNLAGSGIGKVTVEGNVESLKMGSYWKSRFKVTIGGDESNVTVKGNVKELMVIEEFKGNVFVEGTVSSGAVCYVEDPMLGKDVYVTIGLRNRFSSVPAGRFRITDGVWSEGIFLKNPVNVTFDKKGLTIPEDLATLLSSPKLVAEAGEVLQKLVKGAEKLCQIFDISLFVNEEQLHTGFGSLTLHFQVGKEFAGQNAVIYHLHTDGTVSEHKVVVGENGVASLAVTDLSTFMVVIPEAQNSDDPATNPTDPNPPATKPTDPTPPATSPTDPNPPATDPSSPEPPKKDPLTPVPAPGQNDGYDAVPNTGKSRIPSMLAVVGIVGLAACQILKRQKTDEEA